MDYSIKTPQQLGAVLKGFRRSHKLTQAQAGSKVGLAQNVVSELEADPSRAGVARLFKLLAALDLEIAVRPRQSANRRTDW